jgi:sulfate permease, SulP family
MKVKLLKLEVGQESFVPPMNEKNIKFDNLRGDLFGGITAGIVALPLALAFGVQSGLGAAAGMYGAILLGLTAAILGGTASQISGPTGPMTVVSSVVILTAIESYGSIEQGFGFIVAIFVLSGLIQIAFGILKLGDYIRYIPYPVVSGFMSGIGIIIIILSLFPFMGQASPKTVIDVVLNFSQGFANANWEAIILASLTIAVIYIFPKISKNVPGSLVALLFISPMSVAIGFEVPLIGSIPKGLPELKIGEVFNYDLYHVTILIELALTLAVLGAIDSLLTSVIADNVTKTKHNSNRELVGQGIGNMFTGCFGGLPGAGATMRTLVNVNAGGKTRLSGVIHALLLLLILVGLGTFAEQIPLAVLSGILMTVGIGIIDYKGIGHIRSIPKADAWVMVIVLGLTVFVDLIQAVAAGMILSSILFMKKMGDQIGNELKVHPLREEIGIEIFPNDISERIYINHFDGPLFFGFARAFQEAAEKLPDIKMVVLRMNDVPYIDQSGLYALEEVIRTLEKRSIQVVITGLKKQPIRMLRRINIVPGLLSERSLFLTFNDFIIWLKEEIRDFGYSDEFFSDLSKLENEKVGIKYRL